RLVCTRHVDESHLARADPERETELRAIPVPVDAELMDRVDDRVDADKTRDLERGEVQGFTQRLTDGDRAVLLLRRVLRAVALATAVGHVELDVVELGRRRHPQLEHARQVGEELECRPRLTEGDTGVVVVALYLR